MEDTSSTDAEFLISDKHRSDQYQSEFTEASYMLAFWSILVMNEGVVRFIQHGQPAADGLFTGTPIRFFAPFMGALCEVIFGVFGLAVGIAGGVLGYFSKQLTFALIGVQTVTGWYTFITYVFIIPAFRIANEAAPMLGMSETASKAVGTFGILTSLHWCLALQGGQFVFMSRLMAYGGEEDFLNQRLGSRMRSIFWNFNYLLAGLWAIVSACIIIYQKGSGITSPGPFFAPPNVGRIPVYLLVCGLLMVLWSLIGIAISLSNNKPVVRKYVVASFFVFLFVHVHYTIGQLGFIAANPAPSAVPAAGAALHNHLTFMVCFLGPYFMLKACNEEE